MRDMAAAYTSGSWFLSQPMRLLQHNNPCVSRWSSPTGCRSTRMLNFHGIQAKSEQESRSISITHPSAASAPFYSFSCTRLSRNVSSNWRGKTRTGPGASHESANSAGVRNTDEGQYPSHLRSNGGRPNLAVLPLVIALAIPLLAGVIDSAFNNPNKPWYRNLDKPAWTPPDWVFGVVWSVLYTAMGFASWLVWAQGGWEKQAYPLIAYGVQLILNLLWVAAFFGAENLGLAMSDMILLIIAISVCIAAFQPVNPIAADIMKIYLVWVFFAAILNYTLWVRNT